MSESTYPEVNDLTLEEKASLTSGGDAWHLQGVEAKGIPGYMITDGPHGLRKSLASSTGETDLNDSVPATCFPPAAGLSSSWNPELIHQVGEAMAEECIQEKVAVILGPGVNIKRNPLGGRCFEYWSEDPYLAGHEAIGIVAGVQSKGIGTSSSTSPPTTRRPIACASAPTSPSARCAKSTSRLSSTSSRKLNRGPSCAPTTVSMVCIPRRTTGCSPTCCVTNGASKASS